MQLKLFKTRSATPLMALALASLTLATPKAHAFTAAGGDLIFGVRDVSTTTPVNNVYLFDLGKAPASSTTIASSLASDLSATFGSDWFTNTSLKWSISGYDPNTGDVIGSKVETTLGNQSSPYSPTPFSGAQINTIENHMNNVYTEFNNGSTDGVAGFPNGGFSSAGGFGGLKTDVNGYSSNMPGYSTFGASFEANGFTSQAVDLYDISGNVAGDVNYAGTFKVDSSGNVSFSATPSPAPEPGRAMLVGVSLVGMLLRRRRATTKAVA
jgi:hypothetical protein